MDKLFAGKTRWVYSKAKIVLGLLYVCIAIINGCSTTKLWQPGNTAEPMQKISGEIIQIIFNSINDKVYFQYRLRRSKEKTSKKSIYPKYEIGYFSFRAYPSNKLKEILGDPYAKSISHLYAVVQHHASDLAMHSSRYPDCFSSSLWSSTTPLGDQFWMILGFPPSIEFDKKFSFEKDIPKELEEFSIKNNFKKSSIFFVYRYFPRLYFDFVNNFDFSESEIIGERRMVNCNLDFYVMSKPYKYSLPLRIVGTPFSAAVDIITFPFQLLFCAFISTIDV